MLQPQLFHLACGRKVPRTPSWSRGLVSLLELTLELPVYWHTSEYEQAGFVRAITSTDAFAEEVFESPLQRYPIVELLASIRAAKIAWELISRDVGDSLATKFYIAFLKMLDAQHEVFSGDLCERKVKVSKLIGAALRFGLETYFTESHDHGLPAKEMRQFVHILFKYLMHGHPASWKKGYHLSKWMSARTEMMLKNNPRLDRSTWGQMSQAIATFAQNHPTLITSGMQHEIGLAIHHMWGMQVAFSDSEPRNSILRDATRAGREKEVKEALIGFRKALRITPFKTRFGDTAETRAIFAR